MTEVDYGWGGDPHLLLFLCALRGTRPPSPARFSVLCKQFCLLWRDQEAEFRVAASRGRPCQIRTVFCFCFCFFFLPMPAQHTSHSLLSYPFKLIWLKIRPQKHFALCSQLQDHTCLTSLSTSLFSVSITLVAIWSPFS